MKEVTVDPHLVADRALGLERKSRRGHRLKVYLPLALILAGLVFLVIRGLSNSLVYFHTVDEVLSMEGKLGNSSFRLEGVVVPKSVHTNSVGGVDFRVSGADGRQISVIDSANPPELFQPNLPVVLVGNLSHGIFYSNEIMVKHSASYIAAHPSRVASVGGKKI